MQVAVVGGEEQLYSRTLACPDCGINVPQLEPRSFSFNSAYGACPECHGLGSKYDFDPAKVIVDWSKPLLDGGTRPGLGVTEPASISCKLAAAAYGIDLSTPFEKFPEKMQNLLLLRPSRASKGKTGFRGILGYLKQQLDESSLRELSRVADGLHVGDRVPGLPRQAPASGEPGGEGERHVDRRLHGAAGFARAGDGAQRSS